MELIEQFEANGEFDETRAREFVATAVETFRWRGAATVPAKVYRKLHSAHPLVADVACFDGPHINHLTLAALDIDAAQQALAASEMNPKAIIEGPPRRRCPILLRQTSFKALPEPVVFPNATGAPAVGVHPRGLAKSSSEASRSRPRGGRSMIGCSPRPTPASRSPAMLERRGAYGRTPSLLRSLPGRRGDASFGATGLFPLFVDGRRREADRRRPGAIFGRGAPASRPPAIEPIVYEDILLVSAAGIFRSNLDATGSGKFTERSNGALEESLRRGSRQTALYQEARRPRSTRACARWGCAARRRGVRRSAWQRMKTLRRDIGERTNSHN